MISWKGPPAGWVKLHTDAASKGGSTVAVGE